MILIHINLNGEENKKKKRRVSLLLDKIMILRGRGLRKYNMIMNKLGSKLLVILIRIILILRKLSVI